ncbi:hypothetical protein PsorP6_007437 [Peronosclerospora sorghi]|uniref:Uncharacterized protein n=1 Tax=Peronosclerospora sorghi TaxID=230839 RepID=A0ACC0WAU8_9STRA|nr:hypothetical protein PsorP6_007437 [Peronosclerospora sorghi]
MASDEMSLLRYQLEILNVESNDLRQRFDRIKLQVAAAVNTLKLRLSLDNGNVMSSYNRSDGLEPIMEDVNVSQSVHRSTIEEEIVSPKSPEKIQSQVGPECYMEIIEKENNALRQTKLNTLSEQSDLASSNCEKKSQDSVSVAEQRERAIVDKLASELQNIMQELAQLQSDHEKAALEKAELQAETDKMCEEVEITQRQMREMSEKLMEKEHQAKVLQAQLNAKLVTISQMQAKHEKEVDSMQQMIQELTSQNEQHSKARDDVAAELEKVSCEHSNCLEELRALESQLMQVSEEKITLAVAADEHISKLGEAQQEILSSASTISMLQAELEEIQSEKASVEASKNAAEHSMQSLQTAWTALQAYYAAMVEQVKCRGTVLSENESCATETNCLQ